MSAWPKWLSLAVPVIVYGVGILCALTYESDWPAKQTWVVVLTGIILIWYTWETMLIRKLAALQREGQIRPFVVFRMEAEKYVVENIGSAAALDVRIDSTTIKAPGLQIDITFPQAVPLLKAGTVSELEVDVQIDGEKTDPVFAAHLDPQYAVADIDVHIRFKNLEGKEYALVEVISPRTVSIKGFRDESAL